MSETSLPSREVSIYFRLNRDGHLGPLNRRFFSHPSTALAFLSELYAIKSPQIALITLAEREVGDWREIDLRALEAAAAEEVAR